MYMYIWLINRELQRQIIRNMIRLISYKLVILNSFLCVSITWSEVGFSDDRYITRTRGGERDTVYSKTYRYIFYRIRSNKINCYIEE